MDKNRFDESYPIEMLRGKARLSPGRVRKTLANRASYLAKKLESLPLHDSKRIGNMNELAAIAQMMEVYEKTIFVDRVSAESFAHDDA